MGNDNVTFIGTALIEFREGFWAEVEQGTLHHPVCTPLPGFRDEEEGEPLPTEDVQEFELFLVRQGNNQNGVFLTLPGRKVGFPRICADNLASRGDCKITT